VEKGSVGVDRSHRIGRSAGTYWFLTGRPVEVVNLLAAPVSATLSSGQFLRLEPGASSIRRVRTKDSLIISWRTAPGTRRAARTLAVLPEDALEGRTTIALSGSPFKIARVTISLKSASESLWGDLQNPHVAPLITNASSDSLEITVFSRMPDAPVSTIETECGCWVQPGASRKFIGYYPGGQSVSVRARTADGRSAGGAGTATEEKVPPSWPGYTS
jgi:hypothetical protein